MREKRTQQIELYFFSSTFQKHAAWIDRRLNVRDPIDSKWYRKWMCPLFVTIWFGAAHVIFSNLKYVPWLNGGWESRH